MESQQESMALSGILGKLRWNHVRNYFINGPQASVELVWVSVCVCAAQRVANLLHATQTVQKVNWLRQFRVCPCVHLPVPVTND